MNDKKPFRRIDKHQYQLCDLTRATPFSHAQNKQTNGVRWNKFGRSKDNDN
jgi:hypothetical protein